MLKDRSIEELIEMSGLNLGQMHKCKGNVYNKMEDHWVVYPSKNPPHESAELIDKICENNGGNYTAIAPTLQEALVNFVAELKKMNLINKGTIESEIQN